MYLVVVMRLVFFSVVVMFGAILDGSVASDIFYFRRLYFHQHQDDIAEKEVLSR